MRSLCLRSLCTLALLGVLSASRMAEAATYYVDQANPAASDTSPGTAAAPWKTLSRAGGAAEIKPGDSVLIKSGVYRDPLHITVSGTPGKPVTFAAAPGAMVVIKGSKIITGDWTQYTGDPNIKEPYPNAFHSVWKIHLDDSYFQDLPADGHYVSRLFLGDTTSFQQIGTDEIRTDTNILSPVGKDLSGIYQNAFYFDKPTQTLYLDLDGRPEWYCLEVGTTGYPLKLDKVHDVDVRGLQVRQNRQSNASMVGADDSERVIFSDCSFTLSDFQGFGFARCKNCTIKNCVMSYNGDNGCGFYQSTDCVADHCRVMGNNTRHFNIGWHAGGFKNIPGNTRCTVQNCIVGDNEAPGIWFDDGNTDCRILHNVVYNNVGTGVMYEISPGGATIADNLIFSNRGRGIYISGSENVKIFNNTVANNDTGIVMMPRDDPHKLENCLVQNNLLLGNYKAAQAFRGCDVTVFLDLDDKGQRHLMSNHSQSNLYATGLGYPTLRAEWNIDIQLPVWQQKYGEDKGSKAVPFLFAASSNTFQITDPQAASKRAIATPLPAGSVWKPSSTKTVGSSFTAWPVAGL